VLGKEIEYVDKRGRDEGGANRSNQESKFGHSPMSSVKIDEGEQSSAPTDNQIYAVPANQFSPSAGTTLANKKREHQSQ